MKEPTVKNGYLENACYPAELSIKSDEWGTWLSKNRKFKIETALGSVVTAYKLNGLWVAQKRVKGKLRQKRLGHSQTVAKMPWEELAGITDALNSQTYGETKQEKETQNTLDVEQAIQILRQSLTLQGDTDGAIKTKIREAIALLEN